MHQPYISMIIIGLLILFGVYRRIKRNIGLQPFSPKRMRGRMILLLVLCAFILAFSYVQPLAYLSDVLGAIIGLILAYFSSHTTKFEFRGEKRYYRPNVWIGAFVLLLFLGRLLFRVIPAFQMLSKMPKVGAQHSSVQAQPFGSDPWTAGLIFIFIVYYIGYYFFLLRKARQLPESPTLD